MDRRQFLALGSGLLSYAALPSRAFAKPDYKALVCIQLNGGIDGFDCLIPTHKPDYDQWASLRTSMLEGAKEGQRAREALLGLPSSDQKFGFAPELRGFLDLYKRGDLAVVPNVGPLLEPATAAEVRDRTVRIPLRLASHNDQQSTWRTMAPEGAVTGWGGRMLDVLGAQSALGAVAVRRRSSFVVGKDAPGITLPAGPVQLPLGAGQQKLFGSSRLPDLLSDHFRGIGQSADGYFEQDILAAQRRAYDATLKLAGYLNEEPAGESVKAGKKRLGDQLAMVAKMIAVRDKIGAARQVFAVTLRGFDTHRNQFKRLPKLQEELSAALLAFQNELEALGVADQVTSFTISDFGRSLVSNHSGTDHGWGGHHYIMGGAVRGGRIYGTVPPYAAGHDLDWRRGATVPSISIEQYAEPLGRWFGLGTEELRAVFPHAGRFDQGAVPIFG